MSSASDYGFRLESGRLGPRGNERLARLLERLEEIHAEKPLDHILISGDITDAGRSSEWAEFFTAILRHPNLAARMLLIPGNHDINVVDRTNPARLDFPTSPGRRLREMRTLSGIAAVQAKRVHVVNLPKRRIGRTLEKALVAFCRRHGDLRRYRQAAAVGDAREALGGVVSDDIAARRPRTGSASCC